MSWVLDRNNEGIWEWFTWVFNKGTSEQCCMFCCGLWLILTSQNKFLYENRKITSTEISNQIISYVSELKGVEERKLSLAANRDLKHVEQRISLAIYFDATFNQQCFRSAAGLIVQSVDGGILASK